MPRTWISLALPLSFPGVVVGCTNHHAPSSVELAEPPTGSGSNSFEVDGIALDAHGRGLARRSVRIVDARGERRIATSDDEGRFHVAAVTPPYDVAISTDAVLGVSERAPRLIVGTTAPSMAAIEHVTAMVKPPPCNAPPCWISVVTSSTFGSGSASTRYTDAAPTAVRVAHGLSRMRAPEDDIEVHALTGDASQQTYAYAKGGVEDSLAPAAVERTRPVSVEVNAPNLSDDWTFATSLSVAVGRAVFDLSGDDARVVSARIPVIDDATVRARTVARLAPFGERPEWQRSVEAWASRHVSATGDVDRVTLDVAEGPELVQPTGATEMSSRTGLFEWSALDSSTWATLAVTDLTTNAVVIRARTRGRRVSLMRLSALELARLASGPHLVELTSHLPNGSVATQRVPFTAVP